MVLNDVSLRPASEADADFVYSLTEACMRGYVERTWGEWSPDMVRAAFEPAISQIVRCGGNDIGCIELTEGPSYLNLGEFYIAPDHQNRGIGSDLMRQFISRARSSGKPIRLRVLCVNPARRFYERHGFTINKTTTEWHYMEWRAAT